MTSESASPTPDAILQLGFGFAGSKALLSAVELGLFTTLADGPLTAKALIAKLGLQQRGTPRFPRRLGVAGHARASRRARVREHGCHRRVPRPDKPSYIGGMLEMANARLYPFWGSLSEALRTGHPQNETKGGENFFTALYQDPDRLKQFLRAMSAASMGAVRASPRSSRGASTARSSTSVRPKGAYPSNSPAPPHLTGGGFDLPPVAPIFKEYVSSFGLADRLRFYPGDFFVDPLPTADVLIMGRILHDWSLEEKLTLLGKAHTALPEVAP